MATDKGFLDYILDQLSGVEELTAKPMMGEYILYSKGRIFGGVYDNRLLFKALAPVRELNPEAEEAVPYPGAKPMLAVDPDDRDRLERTVEAMWEELPEPKARKCK